jgi:cell division protein FtsW
MRSARRGVLICTALLAALGVVMVYSSSAIYAHDRYGDAAFFLKRHLVYLSLGLLCAGAVLALDPKQIRRGAKTLMVVVLLLLLAVLVPGIGHKVSGARRWFRVGIFSIQPSELAQLAVILYYADVLTRKRGLLKDFFQGVLPALMVLGLTLVFILAEPDLGTSVAIAVVAVLMLFLAEVEWRYLLPLFLSVIPVVTMLVMIKPYRVRRVLAYLNPWADPEGSGFQLIQSLVALGSGGWFGQGLGESRQKLFYLPAAHTDFIFSVIGEELGFIGATGVLILLGLLCWYGFRLAASAPDSFGFLAGTGIVALIGLEALVHVGVATGAIPTKGLPLPFVSYGGSSLIVNLISIAVLLNVARPSSSVG